LWKLHEELSTKTYRPGAYRSFFIYEPKKRQISAAPYRDRVVHHALTGVLEPIFERSFIADSYACRKGKGTHAAVDRCQQFARRSLKTPRLPADTSQVPTNHLENANEADGTFPTCRCGNRRCFGCGVIGPSRKETRCQDRACIYPAVQGNLARY